ncbi:BZ3500_MvSof-1268-A1-R1_Chr11-2g03375 [Microbotryum saponariae]|uniref:BZ3500_MvSof-1268-A1-R1_Chr11-2g03375 protein n=1 Tax=Microbotryum saponariae TaxID=289078 RepID=A0A2X0LDT7_9BASI|nr:BZ3500_MvSof-1268-A1-R1_Chr11-2g03375 [Microbotryum saponariae]SDA03230.1 BZ3501_MvSof-1269-A2-R1_Chr11g02946 [Microbotryum saponariae]
MAKANRGNNRGGARGGGPPGGASRGGATNRGAAAGRGRGGGGASSSRRLQSREDMSELSFDYSSLTEEVLGYNLSPSFPAPKVSTRQNFPPPTPPNGGHSGYHTPKRGVGCSGARDGGPSRRETNHHQNPISSFRGRGGAAGLGSHNITTTSIGFRPSIRGRGGIVGFTPGGHRPLLVPVTFVAASGLTPKMQGDLDVDEVPGELEEKVVEGHLVESVRDLDQRDESSPEDEESTSESDEQDEVGVDVTERIVVKEKETTLVAGGEVSEIEEMEAAPSFVIDLTASRVEDCSVPPPLVVPSDFVLGVSSNTAANREQVDSDSDDDEEIEQIVFNPTASTSSNPSSSAPRAARAEVSPPTITKEAVAAPEPMVQPRTKKAPAPKLTKAQKRAGKKARRAGRLHVRSGNQHLLVEAESSDEDEQAVDEEDARQGREMFARLELNGDAEAMQVEEGGGNEGEDKGEEAPKPRVGDSDLEWGSDGPPGMETRSSAGIRPKAKKELQKRQRREQRELEKMQRLASGARSHVEKLLGGNRAMDDFARNLLGETEEGDIDLEAARRFAEGMMGSSSGVQKNLDELVDEAREEQEDGQEGWRTTSGSEDEEDESGSESDESSSSGSSGGEEFDSNDELERDHTLGESDAAIDRAMADAEEVMMDDASSHRDSSISSGAENDAIEAALLAGQTIRLSSVGVSGPGGRRDRKERKRAKKGKGRWVESDSGDEEDDEVRMFTGENTWAENDEDFIQELQDVLDTNESLLLGSGRKNRKKLFKAVQNGNFDDIDLMLEDDVLLTSGPSRKSKTKSKASKPAWDGEFADELQAQWENDRAKKSDFKRKRALARAEANEAAPHKFKKGHVPPASFAGSSDVAVINLKMREFILHDLEQGSLSLPPMSKKSRVAVHLLSEAYGLNSKSVGKGKARFPVLVRTQKTTTYGVDERKIRAIISTAEGEKILGGAQYGGRAKGKQGGLWAALSGDGKKSSGAGGGGGGMGGKRHDEGAVVGQGADRLGEDNIGFALLKRMGWSEGMQIGRTGGISEPIAARIKTNKSGLGSGYSVSRIEAQIMAAGPGQ